MEPNDQEYVQGGPGAPMGDDAPPPEPQAAPRQEFAPTQVYAPQPPPAPPEPAFDAAQVRAMQQELEQLRGMRSEFDTTRSQLEQMAQNWNRLRQVVAPEAAQPDPNTQFWGNPMQSIAENNARLKQEVMQELTQQYQQHEARTRFWQTFYNENPQLTGFEWVVESTINNNPELQQLSFLDPQTRVRLAQAAQANALAIAQKFGGAAAPTREGGAPPLRVVEGGGGARRGTPASRPTTIPDEPLPLAQMIALQRRQRREAASSQ